MGRFIYAIISSKWVGGCVVVRTCGVWDRWHDEFEPQSIANFFLFPTKDVSFSCYILIQLLLTDSCYCSGLLIH